MKTELKQAINRQWRLKSRPVGEPKEGDFEWVQSSIPSIKENELLVKNIYLSLDPYVRGRMSDAGSYAAPLKVGGVIEGIGAGRVVQSKHPDFQEGDWVCSFAMGWQDYAVLRPEQLMLMDQDLASPSYALGVLGMPGFTGYMGLLDIGQPKAGETIVVAAATGPVGSAVGQIGKIKNCYVVGIAGGREKCEYATQYLGFDACVDRRSPTFAADLANACPKGIDIYFENVGGKVFDAVMPLLNTSARIPVCGLISNYNATGLPDGKDRLSALAALLLTKRIRMQGFIIFEDYAAHFPAFKKEMRQWLKEGKVKYKEEMIQGLEQAPRAFIGLLRGENFGKLAIQVSEMK